MLGLGQLLHTQAIMPGKGREVLMDTASKSKVEVGRNLKVKSHLKYFNHQNHLIIVRLESN